MGAHSKRVLLTGSRGFTGPYLRTILEEEGYDVVGLIIDGEPTSTERLADLRVPAQIAKVVSEVRPSFVIHLAGISLVPHADTEEIYETNTIGTLHLLQALAAQSNPPARVILASTANVYGDAGHGPIDEATLPAPLNHYAASKLAMEGVASVYRQQLSIVITRPFNYTGPGQSPHFLVPKIVAHFARRAERIELGDLDVERDFLDVRSVAAIYAALLDCPAAHAGAFNICSGRAVPLRAIIELLEKQTGHKIQVDVNPRFVRKNEIKRLVGSRKKLDSIVPGWPSYDLGTTLADMLFAAEKETLT